MLVKMSKRVARRVLHGFICVLFVPVTVFSEPNRDAARPIYHFEFLTFKAGVEYGTSLEIVGEIPVGQLRFVEIDGVLRADFQVSAVLVNSVSAFVAQSVHTDSVGLNSWQEVGSLSNRFLRFRFILAPGDYHAVLQVTDKRRSNSSKFVKKIHVPSYERGLQLSDLQLSDAIERTEEKTNLVKNGWRISPNPSRVFGEHGRSLYVYSEIYNLVFGVSEEEKGLLSYITILDDANCIVTSMEIPTIKVGGQSTLVAKVPISMLAPGRYELLLNVQDLASGDQVEKSAYFFVRKADLVAQNSTK